MSQKGIWYFYSRGFSLNEGAGPMNLTVLFPWSYAGLFIYIYIFGWRWVWPKRLGPQGGVKE